MNVQNGRIFLTIFDDGVLLPKPIPQKMKKKKKKYERKKTRHERKTYKKYSKFTHNSQSIKKRLNTDRKKILSEKKNRKLN